jgi:glycosyltransferase involved in cell wall biosynthesis
VHRVLTACPWLPPISGGAEHVAWEVSKRLVGRFDAHLLTIGTEGTRVKDGVRIHYVPRVPYPMTVLYSTLLKQTLWGMLREISPDIIHFHIPLPFAYVFRKSDLVKILTCHGLDVFPKERKTYPKRFFLARALRGADVVTTPSRWLADYIRENYSIPCVHIPNGVDTNAFAPVGTMHSRNDVILYVGRLIQSKGIMELIDAARALPEYEFWFVGDRGPDDAEEAVRVPRLPNIKIIGPVDDVAVYYNQATLCVFPSHAENFPLAGLEAMACGKAMVATRLGFSEYVEDGRDGILIEPQDSCKLVRSIRYLMEDENVRRDIEKKAREKAMRYDWKTVMEQYVALYERVL